MSPVPEVLTSDQPLENVDQPFKLSAGPGAGKTHWLAEHVRAVIEKSERLHGMAKVACITYTQIGAETLARRLVGYEDQVEVCTIHSFLYRHVVRPYAHVLGETSLKTAHMKGHELRRPSARQGKDWLKAQRKSERLWYAPAGFSSLLENDVRWRRDDDGSWQLGFRSGARLSIKGGVKAYSDPEALLAYKHSHWEKGRIDHDDVIALAHRVLFGNAAVIHALVQRFPVFFLDEFQDTSQYQCEIVRALAVAGAIVGVIGDRHQAIYEFGDAHPELFDEYEPDGGVECKIVGNRRSTRQIVRVLNSLRADGLVQESTAETPDGPQPVVLVGALADAVGAARGRCGGEALGMVARSHNGVAKLVLVDGETATGDIWADCSDPEREVFLLAVCRAVRHFDAGEGRLALNVLSRLFRGREVRQPLQGPDVAGEHRRRALKIEIIGQAVSFSSSCPEGTVGAFYQALDTSLRGSSWGLGLKGAKAGGRFATWAAATRLDHLMASVRLEDTRAQARTIHGYKGDETDALLVFLDNKTLRKKLSSPGDSEADRLIYVALSRAKKRLFVSVPELPSSEESRLVEMGFDVERL